MVVPHGSISTREWPTGQTQAQPLGSMTWPDRVPDWDGGEILVCRAVACLSSDRLTGSCSGGYPSHSRSFQAMKHQSLCAYMDRGFGDWVKSVAVRGRTRSARSWGALIGVNEV